MANSFDDVVAYIDALAPGQLDDDTLHGFLESGPEMIRFLADNTPVRLRSFTDFPDYQSGTHRFIAEGRVGSRHSCPVRDACPWALHEEKRMVGVNTESDSAGQCAGVRGL